MSNSLVVVIDDVVLLVSKPASEAQLVLLDVDNVHPARVRRQDAALADDEVEIIGVIAAPVAVDRAIAAAAEERISGVGGPVGSHDHVPVDGKQTCWRELLWSDGRNFRVHPEQIAPDGAFAGILSGPAHCNLGQDVLDPPLAKPILAQGCK